MGIVVQNNKASYDALNAKYDAEIASYNQQKILFELHIKDFEIQKKA